MRLLTALSLCLLAPAALAEGPDAPLPPPTVPVASADAPPAPSGSSALRESEMPERCRPIAKRARAQNPVEAMSTRIVLAGCVADARMATLSLIDGQESMLELEGATRPALAMLDAVIDAADPGMKISALRAKAELYARMARTMMDTVPPPANTSPEAAVLRETRREIVHGMLQPWRERMREAREAIVALGVKHPELARNPVARAAIRDAERELAETVAGG